MKYFGPEGYGADVAVVVGGRLVVDAGTLVGGLVDETAGAVPGRHWSGGIWH
jgi:hypothetical protein